MKTFHIYTDVSLLPLKNFHTKAAVIVVNSHITDVIYKERQCKEIQMSINYYERTAIIWAIKYVERHYKTKNIIVYCDNKHAVNKGYKEYNLKWIKGHSKYNNYKYKFQKLADWISKNGIDNWKDYYYKYLLK